MKATNSCITEETITSSTHLSRNNALLFKTKGTGVRRAGEMMVN
jgi:hypothetical protein